MEFIEVHSILIERSGVIIFANTIGAHYYVDSILIGDKAATITEAISMLLGSNERVIGEYDSVKRQINLFYFGQQKQRDKE